MKGALAVCRRELFGSLESLSGLATALLFCAAVQALYFLVGYSAGGVELPSFWEGREATLRPLFVWLPLLYVVLVPALTMGAWAEERRSGTEELLLTLPMSVTAAVVGKFLARWLHLCLLLVVAIVPTAAVVAALGPLDLSAAAGGLVGAALMGAACVALGLWVSALAADQLVAFLFGAVLLGALWGAGVLARLLPPAYAEAVSGADPAAHYLGSLALGVLDVRDLVYFALLVALGLALAVTAVEGRRWSGGPR